MLVVLEAVLALVAVAVGALIQGSIGFGYAFVAVPAIALLYPQAVPVRELPLDPCGAPYHNGGAP